MSRLPSHCIWTPLDISLGRGNYVGTVFIGQQQTPVQVIFDSGSSEFMIRKDLYSPKPSEVSTLAQFASYGDGSYWSGGVIHTNVSVGHDVRIHGEPRFTEGSGVHVALGYELSSNMLPPGVGGIFGLGFKANDTAYDMGRPTYPDEYTRDQIRGGTEKLIDPWFKNLRVAQLIDAKFALLTKRSAVDQRQQNNNLGAVIIGEGEGLIDFYTPPVAYVRVARHDYWTTTLKAVAIGDLTIQLPRPSEGNSIIDTGTQNLCLYQPVLDGLLAWFDTNERRAMGDLFRQGLQGEYVDTSALVLAEWPTLTFVLQALWDGDDDVELQVPPEVYWQDNADASGRKSTLSINGQRDPQSILGLPIMNPYFTIFDNEFHRHGLSGAITFAKRTEFSIRDGHLESTS